ncbi:ADP-ribosylglycohydrolase family protein [Saccharopolyspora hattusasensis]|uniref:ADP-ribosylglycohydrolase family protein n=1 Tax=Saccharopolyspora hattusasensis TaxID=1128679 RepID=UPI003D95D3DA
MTDAQSPQLSWAQRFRGAMLGGAVGDALGAGVRGTSTAEIQQWFGPQGVVDYLPVYGRRGAVTDLTQLTVFTLEALLRAKAANPGGNGWFPTEFVLTNYLRWLHTQGVPWDYAMSAYLSAEPAPTSWLLERPELYSTRNPDGAAIALLGRMARRSPLGADGLLRPPTGADGLADCVVWAAPAMVWSNVPEAVYSTGASTANLFTSAPNTISAAGLHGDVLAQLIRGVPLWDAVTASDRNRLGSAYQVREVPADVRRTVHAAMFVGQRGIRPAPSDIDIEFDTEDKPGELGIALAAVGSTRNFADAVRVAVNQSSDSAVTGALAGQLAGAIYGPSGIPAQWVGELELRDVIEILCADATEAFAPPPPPQWAQRYSPNPRRLAGPRELAGGSPNTVEGSAEQTMIMPAITASSDAVDTPPQGIPPQTRAANIGAPTFPAARAETPAEPVEFAATDPSSTGPIPVPRLLSAKAPVEATAVFPTIDAPVEAVAPEQFEGEPQIGAFPPLATPSAAAEVAARAKGFTAPVKPRDEARPASVEERVQPVSEERPQAVSAPAEPDFTPILVPGADDIAAATAFASRPADDEAEAAPRAPEDAAAEPGSTERAAAGPGFAAPEEFAEFAEFAGSAVEEAVAEPEMFAPLGLVAEDVIPAPSAEDPLDAEPPAVSQPAPEREPVDMEPPAREPIDLGPTEFETAPGELEAGADQVESDAPAGITAEEYRPEAAGSVRPEADVLAALPKVNGAGLPVAETAPEDIGAAVELADTAGTEPVAAVERPSADEPVADADAESGLSEVDDDGAGRVARGSADVDSPESATAEAEPGQAPRSTAPSNVDHIARRVDPLAAVAEDVEPVEATGAVESGPTDPADVGDHIPSRAIASPTAAEPTGTGEVEPAKVTGSVQSDAGLQQQEESADAEPKFPEAAPAVEAVPAVPPIVRGEHAKADRPADSAPSLTERVLGCFLGGALGDALGSDLEFISAEEISKRFGPDGPSGLREAYGVHGAITDDTQMTLFTAEGLIRGSVADRMLGSEDPLPEVQLAYQRWLHTQGVDWDAAAGRFLGDYPAPDGWLIEVPGLFKTRAPGKTVWRALARFGDGHPAGSFTEKINDSKGCGGVMRAAPVALCSTDPAEVFRLAARTAALTHSHPAGYQSAGALAVIVQQALLGRGLDDGVWLALQVLEIWEDHEETSAMLKAAVGLAEAGVPTPQQVAETLGGGWVGEEALAIAVCAALAGGEDVELALRIAVHHDGDSDSTGAICGNIVGALLGVSALPIDWLAELELRDVVEQMALDCVAEFGRGAFQPGPAAIEPPSDEDWNERYPVRPQWPVVPEPVLPVAEFPAPKPAPRRISGPIHAETFEGEDN